VRGLEVMVPFKPPRFGPRSFSIEPELPLIARTCRRSSLVSCGSTSGGLVDGGSCALVVNHSAAPSVR
jgi:hypothetical protein